MRPDSRWLTAILLTLPAIAMADAGAPLGTWRGTSLCTVKPSACNDETVVYHVTRAAGGGANDLRIQADKIVDGKALDMGTLPCTWDGARSVLTCTYAKSVFRFQIDGDGKKLTGTLTQGDGTVFRKIAAEKAKEP